MYAFWPSLLISKIIGIFILTTTFFMPLIILIYCYGRIVWVLTRRIDSKLTSSGPSVDTFQLARTNTIKTLLTVALCFVICWSNVEIYTANYYLSNDLESGSYWNNTYFNFTVFMVFLNCTINPFIYLVKYKDFQDALKHCCFRKKSDPHKLSSLK